MLIYFNQVRPQMSVRIYKLIPDFGAKSISDGVSSSHNSAKFLCQNIGNIQTFVPKYRKYRRIFLMVGILEDSYQIYRKNGKHWSVGIPDLIPLRLMGHR